MAFLSGLATGQANVVSCWHSSSDCKFAAFAFLQQRHHILPHLVIYFRLFVYFFPHLWLIVGIWFSSFSIASLCPQAWIRSSLRQVPSSLDRRRGYLLSFWKLPNSLFTFILASSCKLVFSASYSKSNPLILFFLQFGVGHIKQERVLETLEFSSFLLFWTVFARCLWLLPKSLQPVGACCLSPQPLLKCICHLIPECNTQLQINVYLMYK